MLLAIDVGNTNIVLGCLEDGEIIGITRMETDRDKTAHEYAIALKQALEFGGIDPSQLDGAILSSVVPPINGALRAAIRMVAGLDTIVVGPGMKTGLNIGLDDPGTMASDLVVGAAAGLSIHEPPLIIIDMGTATTITAIDKTGTYVGGCISPGPKISAEALSARTAQLPAISLESPKKAIGKNTIDAMRSGVMLGSACMVDGMIDRIDAELGGGATVVATGGIARFVLPMCRHAIEYDRDLLLKGLALLYENNRREK